MVIPRKDHAIFSSDVSADSVFVASAGFIGSGTTPRPSCRWQNGGRRMCSRQAMELSTFLGGSDQSRHPVDGWAGRNDGTPRRGRKRRASCHRPDIIKRSIDNGDSRAVRQLIELGGQVGSWLSCNFTSPLSDTTPRGTDDHTPLLVDRIVTWHKNLRPSGRFSRSTCLIRNSKT